MEKLILLFGAMLFLGSEVLHAQDENPDEPIQIEKTYTPPLKLVPTSDWPSFEDDLEGKDLQLAFHRQLKKFYRRSYNNKIHLNDYTASTKLVPASILAFQEIFNEWKFCADENPNDKAYCWKKFKRSIKNSFNLYRPKDQSSRKGSLFTGYYTPTIEAKTEADEDFSWGIYKKPNDDKQASLSRNEIDFKGALKRSGYDLFYTNDHYSNYLLHIEGGGRLKIKDQNGTRYQYISYDGTNGQRFSFIFRYMLEKGYIDDARIESQRAFLEANPDKHEEVYSTCPSYVYFKPTDHPPYGNEGTPLTNGRSIATDSKLYRYKGLISFISGPIPDHLDKNNNIVTKQFKRFFIDHDTGGAIKTSARADLFLGEDERAEFQASYLHHRGDMYFLALKRNKHALWFKIFDELKDQHQKMKELSEAGLNL